MSVPRHVRATAASVCGPTRPRNEDIAILGDVTVRDSSTQAEWSASELRRPFLAAVLDGLGGHQGGAEASGLVATRLATSVSRWAVDCSPASLRDGLVQCISDAHRELNDAGQRDPTKAGMGTTCTALLFAPNVVLLAHVGDSRCYRKRDGLWKQLSQDHSILVTNGAGPSLSRLTCAVGASLPDLPSDPVADLTDVTFAGDVYLLVTDGVLAAAAGEEMLDSVFDSPDAAQLLEHALMHGGPDNATAVRLEVVS